MANTNSPFGFRWHGLSGDPVTPASGLVTVKVASTNTGVFGEGDPVLRLSTGYVTAFTRTTVVSQLVGIFQSCEYYSTSQGRQVYKNYWPGSDATGDVLVHVNPCSGSVTPRFLVQSSGATAITFGNVGINVDIAAGTSTAGTVTGGFYRSACTIDLLANVTTTSTTPFRIIGLWSDYSPPGAPGSDNTTPYNWVIVEANINQNTGI